MKESLRGGLAGRLGVVAMLAAASGSAATTIQLVDPNTGVHSGWQASFPDNLQVSLVVDAVTEDAVFIEKFVDFDQPPGPGGLFPAVNIDFTQTLPDDETVPSIVILDEGLTNLTGADWTGFNWLIIDDGEAWFNVPASSGFNTDPFVNQTFSDFVDNDPNRAMTLRTDGGVVPHLSSFFPGSGTGVLQMDIDLSLADITSFNLKEVPIPEPAAALLLGLGALIFTQRRRIR